MLFASALCLAQCGQGGELSAGVPNDPGRPDSQLPAVAPRPPLTDQAAGAVPPRGWSSTPGAATAKNCCPPA
jgi:hypothetical protein